MYLDEGAKQRYAQMFQGLPNDWGIQEDIRVGLNVAMDTFKRQDRAIWYLRWVRVNIDNDLATKNKNDAGNPYRVRIQKFKEFFGNAVAQDTVRLVLSNGFIVRIRHFLSLPIQSIQNLVWDRQSPVEILDHFRREEDKWKAEQGQYIDMSRDDQAELVMEFPDGFAWFDLNRPYCNIEGGAMGHCGNAAARDGTVLSLRHKSPHKGKESQWRPVATFILRDGIIGEMKGRANKKPEARYHPYIVALLRHDLITGIRGGGYDPRENFNINDLDDETRDELIAAKPELGHLDIHAIYTKAGRLDHNMVIIAIETILEKVPRSNHLIPVDWTEHEMVGPRTLAREPARSQKVVYMESIGDRNQLVREMAYFMPIVKELDDLYDQVMDADFKNISSVQKIPHSGITEDETRAFYQALSPKGREWVNKRLRIVSGSSDGHTSRVEEVMRRIHQGIDSEFTRYYDLAVARLDPGLDPGLDPELFNPENIKNRIDEYLGYASIACPSYDSFIHLDGEDYYIALPVEKYLSYISIIAEDEGEDGYWEDGLEDVIRHGWFSTEHASEDEDNVLQSFESLITSKEPEKSHPHRSFMSVSNFTDAVYGDYLGLIDEELFDKFAPAIDPRAVAQEFENILFGRSSRAEKDDQTGELDLAFKESLMMIRKMAGLGG